ncbi:MAG: hypothetical protein WBH31_13950 [Promethearchaeia archaeon]
MTEITNSRKSDILPEEKYWEQLDLLFEAYKVKAQQEKLKKKLKKLQKELKKNLEEQNIHKFKALQVVIKETSQKKKLIFSQILDSFNVFKISDEVNNLRGYISELNKALKKRKINVNTYRITFDHYNTQLNFHQKNLDKLNVIAKEYILLLKNKELELDAEYNFDTLKKSKMKILKKRQQNNHVEYNNRKNEIKQKINFTLKFLDKNSYA